MNIICFCIQVNIIWIFRKLMLVHNDSKKQYQWFSKYELYDRMKSSRLTKSKKCHIFEINRVKASRQCLVVESGFLILAVIKYQSYPTNRLSFRAILIDMQIYVCINVTLTRYDVDIRRDVVPLIDQRHWILERSEIIC